jgi:hypothetical protein
MTVTATSTTLSRFVCVCVFVIVSGLVNEFIDHLYIPLRTTGNYSAIANLHTTNHHSTL